LQSTLEELRSSAYNEFKKYFGDHEREYVIHGSLNNSFDTIEDSPNCGRICYVGGTVYTGELENGIPHGRGKMVCQNGIVYDGEWKNGVRHGQGLLTFPSGAKYEGGFKIGHFQGQGTYVSSSKQHMVQVKGSFGNGFLSGTGTVYFHDGRSYTKFWPSDDTSPSRRGFTIHDAIANVEKEWHNQKEMSEKENQEILVSKNHSR
jgi:hypothetical protein